MSVTRSASTSRTRRRTSCRTRSTSREPGRVERRDALDHAGRGARLRVEGRDAGVWMYHCGTAPTLHHRQRHVRHGHRRAEGRPAAGGQGVHSGPERVVSRPAGPAQRPDQASAAAPAPDFVVFNGVANQYKDHPITVGTGERNRIFVLDAGPSVDSSFHIVGTIFDTVIREGVHLAKGNDGAGARRPWTWLPAQGGIVEFTTAEDGLYPVVAHAFNLGRTWCPRADPGRRRRPDELGRARPGGRRPPGLVAF